MNARLRKVTRNRGQFPSEQAALKVLYPAVRNLDDYRRPSVGIRSSRVETSAPGVHDLLRRTNPDPMTATITYTDGRTLPSLPNRCAASIGGRRRGRRRSVRCRTAGASGHSLWFPCAWGT